MLGQITDLAPQGRIFILAYRQHLQLGDYVATLTLFEQPPKPLVTLGSFVLGQG